VTTPEPTSQPVRRRVSPDLLAVLTLVAIPLAVFGGADLFGGHLLLTGDNLIQNYPLRVLAGADLRAGALPAYDPYVWSGTPLAAGLNSSAWFPTTLLFAILPAHVGWVLGEVLVYSSAAVGSYALFRAGGPSPLACFLGACSFAFAGAAAAQATVHIDMGNGIACLPWALLAVRRIVDGGRLRWVLALGVSFGLAVLAGSPEALLGTAAACAAFALLRWSVARGSPWPALWRLGAGVGSAAACTAFVWEPALRFISYSQRAVVSEATASSYSFPPRAGVLAVAPYLEGGYHLFSQGRYFGPSNSGEVTLYVGLLPLVAALSLLARRWGAWLPQGERRLWYGVLAVACVLAVGAGTPLEHLLYHLPFYGRQRDSGRAVVEVDLALSALFTWWVDGGSRPVEAVLRSERAVALVPLGAVLALGSWFALSPGTLWQALDATVSRPRPVGVAAAIWLAGGLALIAAGVVALRGRLQPRSWRRLAAAFVLADLALFSAGSGYLSSEGIPEPGQQGPILSLVESSLSPGGRYAMFDPGLFDPGQLASAGEPDVGVLERIPSVSGYGSLEDGTYASQTDTTARDYLDPGGIAAGSFADLGLQVMVTVPESFLTPVTPSGGAMSEQPGVDPALPGGNVILPGLPVVPRTSPPRASLAPGQVASWWFGTQMAPTEVGVTFSPLASAVTLRVGLVSKEADVRWVGTEEVSGGSDEAAVHLGGSVADGVAVELLSGPALRAVAASVGAGQRSYLVNGSLAGAITPAGWAEVGAAGDFVVFKSRAAPRQAWLAATPTGSVEVTASSSNHLSLAVVSPAPARLVVGVGYDPGWHALVTAGQRSSPATVERQGLVLAVEVPAGTTSVELSYTAEGFDSGLAVAGASAGLIACWLLGWLLLGHRLGCQRQGISRRRTRRSRPAPLP
jgi:hypothetical protein